MTCGQGVVDRVGVGVGRRVYVCMGIKETDRSSCRSKELAVAQLVAQRADYSAGRSSSSETAGI